MKTVLYMVYLAVLVALVLTQSWWTLALLVGIKTITIASLGGLLGLSAGKETSNPSGAMILMAITSIFALAMASTLALIDLAMAFAIPYVYRVIQANLV